MKNNELKQRWLEEENCYFSGWDFSHLKNRWKDENLTWDYEKILKNYLKNDDVLLDMGTGGGEFLLSLKHPHHLCSITEGYKPNVELCNMRLKPLGITVKYIEDDHHIPYDDSMFDVVINRHEDYDLNEVYRVLKKGGYFVTQQVGCYNDIDLIKYLNLNTTNICTNDTTKGINLENALKIISQMKFEVCKSLESFTPLYFYDIGAFVYFAHIIE